MTRFPSVLGLRFYGRSDVGRKRLSNEDSFHTSDEDALGLVCDGMGGHEGGEIASKLAVDVISDGLAKGAAQLGKRMKISQRRALARELVVEWTQKANGEIFKRGGEDTPLRTRMGTTLALILLVRDFVVIAHVGDSRIYRTRGDKIELLTSDHSIVGPSRSPRAWGTAPRTRKFVTKALGTKSSVEPDVRLEDVAEGDVFILCSDGLSDMVKEAEMAEILKKAGTDRRVALRSLIHLANKRGGRDNITVILGEVVATTKSGPFDEDGDDGDTDLLTLPAKPLPAKRRSGSGEKPAPKPPAEPESEESA
jgi:protein phosphatase